MAKAIINIELEFNAIMFEEDIRYELEEWLKNLRFRHLTEKKITNVRLEAV